MRLRNTELIGANMPPLESLTVSVHAFGLFEAAQGLDDAESIHVAATDQL